MPKKPWERGKCEVCGEPEESIECLPMGLLKAAIEEFTDPGYSGNVPVCQDCATRARNMA